MVPFIRSARLEFDVKTSGVRVYQLVGQRYGVQAGEIERIRVKTQGLAEMYLESFLGGETREQSFVMFHRDFVELALSGNRILKIGSQRPEELARAIVELVATHSQQDKRDIGYSIGDEAPGKWEVGEGKWRTGDGE
jgi:hypothetical protein